MKHSEYFRDRAKTFPTCLPERTLNAGIDMVTTIIIYGMAYPYTPQDHRHAPASWTQGRHDVWQDRIDEYKPNPTNESLAVIAEPAIREHTPHTRNDLVERIYRFAKTLIENEPERRRNDNDER